MKRWLWLALLLLPCAMHAQVVGPGFINYVTSAPSGACSQGEQMRVVIGLGTVYTCQNGTWTQVGAAGGAGTVTSVLGTTNQINSDGNTVTPTLSLSSTLVLPGTLTSSGTSLFTTTTANTTFFGIKNTTAAVVGTSQGSPVFSLCGTAFHGSASVEDCMTFGELPGNGNDAAIIQTWGHTGTSTGKVVNQPTGILAVTGANVPTLTNLVAGDMLVGRSTTQGTICFSSICSGGFDFGISTGGKFTLQSSTNVTGTLQASLWGSTTNCSAVGTSASPSVVACAAAPDGAFSCATTASGATCTVNTTAALTNSDIEITQTASAGARLVVTCNTTADVPTAPRIASISNGVSFTINLGTVAVNPTCYFYHIVN